MCHKQFPSMSHGKNMRDIPLKSHGIQWNGWEVCMSCYRGESSWDKAKCDAWNLRIWLMSQSPLSIEMTISTFPYRKYNNFISRIWCPFHILTLSPSKNSKEHHPLFLALAPWGSLLENLSSPKPWFSTSSQKNSRFRPLFEGFWVEGEEDWQDRLNVLKSLGEEYVEARGFAETQKKWYGIGSGLEILAWRRDFF